MHLEVELSPGLAGLLSQKQPSVCQPAIVEYKERVGESSIGTGAIEVSKQGDILLIHAARYQYHVPNS